MGQTSCERIVEASLEAVLSWSRPGLLQTGEGHRLKPFSVSPLTAARELGMGGSEVRVSVGKSGSCVRPGERIGLQCYVGFWLERLANPPDKEKYNNVM